MSFFITVVYCFSVFVMFLREFVEFVCDRVPLLYEPRLSAWSLRRWLLALAVVFLPVLNTALAIKTLAEMPNDGPLR